MALYAFDGTWNEDEEGEGKDSNAAKFCHSYTGPKFYLEGVGTRLGFIGKFLGGVTGAGGRIRIREAMAELERNFSAGDRTIDIVGFSRGAALALHFANEINDEKEGSEIRFLGLWDVVASFGLPGNPINIGWHLTLPDNVKKCYHAMALDERRGNFEPTHIKPQKGGSSTEGRLEEVWFRGVHSDVGGGQCIGLSSITLCWMMKRAMGNGLTVDEAELHRFEGMRDPTAPISKNFDLKADPHRRIEQTDCVHESVQPRSSSGERAHNNLPQGLKVISD